MDTNPTIEGPQTGKIDEVVESILGLGHKWVEYVTGRECAIRESAVPQYGRRERHLVRRKALVRFHDIGDVLTVDTDSDTHVHELHALDRQPSFAYEVRPLKCLQGSAVGEL